MLSRPICTALAAALLVAPLSGGAAPGEKQRKNQKAPKSQKTAGGKKSSKAAKAVPWDAETVAAAPSRSKVLQRIEFGPGTMSASLIGQVAKGESRTYLLAGRTGQQVTIRIVGHGGTRPWFCVTGPTEVELPAPGDVRVHPGVEGKPLAATWTLEVDGDYEVVVTEIDGRPSTFTMVVDVRPGP